MSTRPFLRLEETKCNDIQHWQEGTISDDFSEESGDKIAQLLRGCLELFAGLIRDMPGSLRLSKKSQNVIRRGYDTLKLWADGHEALDGNLDRLLERSENLRYTTLLAIHSICGVLIKKLSRLVFYDNEEARALLLQSTNAYPLYEQSKSVIAGLESIDHDDASASDSSSEEDIDTDEVDDVLAEMKEGLICLVDLNNALRCPAVDTSSQFEVPSLPRLVDLAPHRYYADLIHSKYPRARRTVVESLGRANWVRYQRLQEERDKAARSETAILDMSISHIAKSKFLDSGIGTSISGRTSLYAETIASFTSSVSGAHRSQIPSLPIEARNGEKFECLACGMHIKAKTTREWRRHLFSDLQPYVCVLSACSDNPPAFRDRNDWITHIVAFHKAEADSADDTCPLCVGVVHHGKSTLLAHISRHMEEVSLAALPCGVESDADSDSGSQTDGKLEPLRINKPTGSLTPTSTLGPIEEYFRDYDSTVNRFKMSPSPLDPLPLTQDDSYPIQCICGSASDDGNTVLCEKCNTWQHIICFYETPLQVPDVHECTDCHPRHIDFRRTVDIPDLDLGDGSLEFDNLQVPSGRQTAALQPGIAEGLDLNAQFHTSQGAPSLAAANVERGDEPRYCFCNKESYGDMIACDNDSCPRQWFHSACVNMNHAPRARSKWFCSSDCKEVHAQREHMDLKFKEVLDETHACSRATDLSRHEESHGEETLDTRKGASTTYDMAADKEKQESIHDWKTWESLPGQRSLLNIDQLISSCDDEEELMKLKQQRRLLRNRQAALESRSRRMGQDKLGTTALESKSSHSFEKPEFLRFNTSALPGLSSVPFDSFSGPLHKTYADGAKPKNIDPISSSGSNLDQLHTQLSSPTKVQGTEQLFSITPAQYNAQHNYRFPSSEDSLDAGFTSPPPDRATQPEVVRGRREEAVKQAVKMNHPQTMSHALDNPTGVTARPRTNPRIYHHTPQTMGHNLDSYTDVIAKPQHNSRLYHHTPQTTKQAPENFEVLVPLLPQVQDISDSPVNASDRDKEMSGTLERTLEGDVARRGSIEAPSAEAAKDSDAICPPRLVIPRTPPFRRTADHRDALGSFDVTRNSTSGNDVTALSHALKNPQANSVARKVLVPNQPDIALQVRESGLRDSGSDIEEGDALKDAQRRHSARSFVMQRARRERPWSTSKHATKQKKDTEFTSPATLGKPDLEHTTIALAPASGQPVSLSQGAGTSVPSIYAPLPSTTEKVHRTEQMSIIPEQPRQTRQLLSCNSCRERKVKCDRTKPCSACCARGQPRECTFVAEGGDYAPIQQSYELRKLRAENLRLKERLRASNVTAEDEFPSQQ